MTSAFVGEIRFKSADMPRAQAEFIVMKNGWLKIDQCEENPELVGRMYPPTEIVYARHDIDRGSE